MATDWGTDLDWDNDLTDTAAMCSGIRLLSQAVYHRITTRQGTLLDAPDDGIDVRDFLSSGMTETEKAQIPELIRQEIRKDERIHDATVTWIPFDSGFGAKLTVVCEAVDDGTTFTLVCDVTQAAVLLTSTTPPGGEA